MALNGTTHPDLTDVREASVFVKEPPPVATNDYPCPEEVWIGPWRDVAKLVGFADWRVWVGVTAALSARAHRNIAARYYGPLYGMGFYLLVAPSSHGKSVCTDTCRALLPPGYEVFTSVESGQALAESLATFERDERGKMVSSAAFPALLLQTEWSMLLANMDFHGSSLLERFCEIADARAQVDLNRADKKGNGKIRIENPTLTSCATTTRRNYQRVVTERHITSGFINRHLILPGSSGDPWAYNSEREDIDYSALAAYARDSLPRAHTFGLGQPMRMCYSTDAYLLDHTFGQEFFGAIHNAPDTSTTEDVFKRLHVYNRRLAALAAWATNSPFILPAHVAFAHAAIRTSYQFLRDLHGDDTPDLTPTLRAQASLEDLILAKVTASPGIQPRILCNLLKRHGGYTAVSLTIEKLNKAGALRLETQGKLKVLFLT